MSGFPSEAIVAAICYCAFIASIPWRGRSYRIDATGVADDHRAEPMLADHKRTKAGRAMAITTRLIDEEKSKMPHSPINVPIAVQKIGTRATRKFRSVGVVRSSPMVGSGSALKGQVGFSSSTNSNTRYLRKSESWACAG